jgi:cellulose synthase/poly-beta-1,6-N-acetylglucosamine synthase-like glycosyltransferase
MVLLLVLLIFMFLYTLLFYFFWKGWHRGSIQMVVAATQNRFISVIIPARNEENNIVHLLEALRSQTFSQTNFEVIIVDDFSTDATADLVEQFGSSNVRLIQPAVDENNSSKKKAIQTGVEMARGELIVTTDADCVPTSQWLQTIHDLYVRSDANFIAAPVKFTHDNSILETLQAIDFMTLQGITAATVATGSLTMCNGANLAYTKKAFVDVKGFEGIDHVATGDDMLLMYKIRKTDPSKVFYLKNKDAIVSTQPMKTWKQFFMQRKRWASKTLVYDDRRIIAVLAFVYLFNCLFIALIIAAIFNRIYWWHVLGFWILKALVEFPFVQTIARFYDEKKLLGRFFFFQPLHIFYTVFVGLISQFGNYEWKGRTTK